MKKVLSFMAAFGLVMGVVAPVFADIEQLDVEKGKAFLQKEADRSGFSGTSASARSTTTEVGNWYRDKFIGGFHFGPASTDDKGSK